MAGSRRWQRRAGPLLVAVLVALQAFLLWGLREPHANWEQTGALAARLEGASPSEARAVRRLAEDLMEDYTSDSDVFYRLMGISHRARHIAGESWDPSIDAFPDDASMDSLPAEGEP